MLHIKTPATTANMGCGFDCIGMALKLYNSLWVEEIENGLNINVLKQQSIPIPTETNNLIYKTIVDFYKILGKKVPGLSLIQEDNIPLTRGLGSSAACIVSGLLAGNGISKAKLKTNELVEIAAKIEGHPDNSTPALLGGIVVGAMADKGPKYVKVDPPEDLEFAVMIPNFPLSTEKARKVLPKAITLKDAVYNISRAGLLMASILTKNYDNLNVAMDDKLHQPYRKFIIPGMENIFKKAKEYGAKGVFLSGAGPTIIAVIHDNDAFKKVMSNYLRVHHSSFELHMIEPERNGAYAEVCDSCEKLQA